MADSPSPPASLHAGSILGRYELLLPIAKGGMAQVWAARLRGTRGFQKLVAVKTILADAIDSTRLEQMFLEEAQLASQIHHANVVTTHDLGEHEGTLYLVMEWVDGESLSEIINRAARRGGVPLEIGVNLVAQACKGLHAAHTLRDESGTPLGVVHRDVSPQNLLVTLAGSAKLVDFGIAKVTSKSSSLTEAGEVKGKFAYMAPEQVAGQAVDRRADLFALGIVLYFITTGKHPFRGENPAETIKNICGETKPIAPSKLVAGYPSALEAVVMKALEKSREARFESANEMLSALEEALPGPLEASFDAKVADYMNDLVGKRAGERRAAIRVAQEHADRQREGSTSRSASTLRAISIDNPEPTPTASRRTTTAPRESITPASFRPRPKWLAPAGGVLIAASVLGVTLFVQQSAVSPVVPVSVPAPALPAAQPPAPSPPNVPKEEPVAPVATADADERHEETSAGDAAGEARKSRGQRPARIAANRSRAAVAPAASAAVPAPPTSAAQGASAPPASAPAANAWDRQQFGGRF
jgi:eukaryotic-like serine/threonine-protein kinase